MVKRGFTCYNEFSRTTCPCFQSKKSRLARWWTIKGRRSWSKGVVHSSLPLRISVGSIFLNCIPANRFLLLHPRALFIEFNFLLSFSFRDVKIWGLRNKNDVFNSNQGRTSFLSSKLILENYSRNDKKKTSSSFFPLFLILLSNDFNLHFLNSWFRILELILKYKTG